MGRLMIRQLRLHNFKSYAGVRTLGPYDHHFTATVGPNGSGKSNTIDALLFVFGKRASKLRLKKVSELIHRSTTFPNLDYATVEVHFQEIEDKEDGSYEVVPNSRLVVSRTAYKNNSSKYFINGNTSSFTEVTTLLREHGIDLDNNRFLILQGEVEQISQMKPKAQTAHEVGLLEYLEDIIGSNKYVEAIEDAGKQVEELNEQRNERLHRVKAAEKDKDNLESAKLEAEDYLKHDREVQLTRSKLYQLYLSQADEQITIATEKRDQLQQKLQYEREKLQKQETELHALQKDYNSKLKEYENVAGTVTACKKEFASFERQDIKYREDIKDCRARISKLEESVAKEQEKLAKAEETKATTEETIPELEAKVTQLQQEKEQSEATLEEIYASLKGRTEDLRNALETKQNEYEPFASRLNNTDSKLEQTRNELKITKDAIAGRQTELTKLQKSRDDVKLELEQKKESQTSQEEQLKHNQKRLKCSQSELTKMEEETKKIQSQIRALRAEIEESKASQSAATSRSALLENLQAVSRKGGPLYKAGLAGRLGDLGHIDSKYDVAISTACGGLQWLVTDTTEGAQQCVNYLRSTKLGRAKFIMLDKIKWIEKQMNQPIQTPEGVPRLFDLVQPVDDKFNSAFYFVLRNTLVAEDLDQAVRIAYQGGKTAWRVVTLGGDLIDTSGTMSGGGKSVRRGAMSTSAACAAASTGNGLSAAELAKVEKRLFKLIAEHDDARATCDSLTKEIKQLEESIPTLTMNLKKIVMDIESLTSRLEDLNQRIEQLETTIKPTKEEKKTIQKHEATIESLQSERQSIVTEAEQIQQEITSLQDKIMCAGGAKLQSAKESVEQITKQLDETRRAITKAKVTLKTSTKAVNKCQKAVAEAEKELETTRTKLETTNTAFKTLEDQAMQVMQSMEVAEKRATEQSEELESLNGQFKELEASIAKIKSVEVDITSAMEDYETALAKNRKAKASFNTKLQEIQKTFTSTMEMLDDEDDTEGENSNQTPTDEDDQGDTEMKSSNDTDVHNATNKKETKWILPTLTAEELQQETEDELQYNITILEAKRDELKGNVNMTAILEYKQKEKEFSKRVNELQDISKTRDKARGDFDSLRKKRLDEFMAGFSTITLKLKEMYQMLTLGGDAELELVNSLDPFDGVIFTVRPPKKSWKNISNLSGGEKTLASLALVFALHHFKPTPLYVMDEIDAALDFKNVSIVANYIKERTKNAQFIIISLRNNMFELADRLVGIYKTNDMTRSVTIDPSSFAMDGQNKLPEGSSGKGKQAKLETVSATSPRAPLADKTNQM